MIMAKFDIEMEAISQVLTRRIGDKPKPPSIETSTKLDDDSEVLPSTLSPLYVNEKASIHPQSTQSRDGSYDLTHLNIDPQGPSSFTTENQMNDITPKTENSRRKKLTSFFLFYVLLQFVDVGSDLFAGINYITDEELRTRIPFNGLDPMYVGVCITGVIFLPYVGIVLLQISLCFRGKPHSLWKSIYVELPFVNILRNFKNFLHLIKMDFNSDRNEVNRIEEEAFNSAIFEAYLESAVQIMIQSVAALTFLLIRKPDPLEEEFITIFKNFGPIIVSGVSLNVSSTKIFFSKRINNKFYVQDQSISCISFIVFFFLLFRNGMYVALYFSQIISYHDFKEFRFRETMKIFLYPCTTILLTPFIIIFYSKIFRVKFDLLFTVFSTVNAWICPLLVVHKELGHKTDRHVTDRHVTDRHVTDRQEPDTDKLSGDINNHQKYLLFLLTLISNVFIVSFCSLPDNDGFFSIMIPLCITNAIIITPILLFIAHRYQLNHQATQTQTHLYIKPIANFQ